MYSKDIFIKGDSNSQAFERLVDVIRVLRAPDGCPWDRVQTHETLTREMIEEAYEVVQAIENKDVTNLREELGDVMLQVVMHSAIAEDDGEFSLADVCNEVSEKMIGRHPHVFGGNVEKYGFEQVNSVDNVLDLWENVKRTEKHETNQISAMEKIPLSLPALIRAEKIQKKARKVGFDWPDVSGAFAKIDEETAELKEAYDQGNQDHISEELGDLLFAVVNAARFLDVDPEKALNSTSQKFMKRFGYVEEQAALQGRKLPDMSLEEMDALWEESKSRL